MGKKNEKNHFLQRVLESSEFLKHQLDKDLLSYIVHATKQGIDLNESTIAIEVFGRGDKFDPSTDPIVRVHMHSLRKRLATYYMSEGKNDTIKLHIPKGHYAVDFTRTNPLRQSFNLISKPQYLILMLLIVATTFFINHTLKHTNFTASSQNSKQNNNKIWSDYLKNEVESYIILGNMFTTPEYQESITLLKTLNDQENRTGFKSEEIPNQYDKLLDVPLIPNINLFQYPSFCLFDILPIFYSSNRNPRPLLIEDLTWCKIKDNALIFLGDFRSLGMLNVFLSKTRFAYELAPHNTIFYLNENADTLHTYESGVVPAELQNKVNYNIKDYAVVAKIPGPTNLPIFIFSSFFDIGIKEAVRYVTTPSSINKLESIFTAKYGEMPAYFDILFRVNGVDRTGLGVEILHFDKIDISRNKIDPSLVNIEHVLDKIFEN